MKGKENLRSRKNNHTHRANQRSASYDRPHKKSVLSSIVYESSRSMFIYIQILCVALAKAGQVYNLSTIFSMWLEERSQQILSPHDIH